MRRATSILPTLALAALAPSALTLAACDPGPRIEARPQAIAFAPVPPPDVDQGTVTVTATASSGLPVTYGSRTPGVCAVDASGRVTATATGACTVSANQWGNATWAAAPQALVEIPFRFRGTIRFGVPPTLAVFDLGTVEATESAGMPVAFAGATPVTCSVEGATGLVTALAPGDCTVTATAGEASASQTFAVAAPSGVVAPGAPTGVSGRAGRAAGTVEVRVGGVRAGGSPITGWAVASVPPGLSGSGATLPVTVACPGSCAGYRFTVAAASGAGAGPASDPGDVVSRYRVFVTFREPDTRPNDTLFDGGFTLNESTGVPTALAGRLSEAMTGGPVPWPDDTMTWLTLTNPLSAVPVSLGGVEGWLVTTFRLPTTSTFTSDPRFGGTDGWSPGTGAALYAGYPGPNPGNAYAMVFVNPRDPTAPLSQAQIDRLAYADCAPGGMMGSTCMTGTTVAGHGTVGSMGGHPLSQTTTLDLTPHPGTHAQ